MKKFEGIAIGIFGSIAVVVWGLLLYHSVSITGKTELFYLILAVCCVPMYPYVGFFYGEIPSTALTMLAAWIFLSLIERFTYPKLIAMGLLLVERVMKVYQMMMYASILRQA